MVCVFVCKTVRYSFVCNANIFVFTRETTYRHRTIKQLYKQPSKETAAFNVKKDERHST